MIVEDLEIEGTEEDLEIEEVLEVAMEIVTTEETMTGQRDASTVMKLGISQETVQNVYFN